MIRSKTLTFLKYSACRWGPKRKQRNGGVRTREAGSLVLLLRASSYFPFLLLSVCSFSFLLPVIAPQRGRSVSNETHNTTAVPERRRKKREEEGRRRKTKEEEGRRRKKKEEEGRGRKRKEEEGRRRKKKEEEGRREERRRRNPSSFFFLLLLP